MSLQDWITRTDIKIVLAAATLAGSLGGAVIGAGLKYILDVFSQRDKEVFASTLKQRQEIAVEFTKLARQFIQFEASPNYNREEAQELLNQMMTQQILAELFFSKATAQAFDAVAATVELRVSLTASLVSNRATPANVAANREMFDTTVSGAFDDFTEAVKREVQPPKWRIFQKKPYRMKRILRELKASVDANTSSKSS